MICQAFVPLVATTNYGRFVAATEVKCSNETQPYTVEVVDNVTGEKTIVHLCNRCYQKWDRDNQPLYSEYDYV